MTYNKRLNELIGLTEKRKQNIDEMENLFEKKIRKITVKEFIDLRIKSLEAMLNLNLTYEKDLIYQAILDEYLLIKTFIENVKDEIT